MEISSGTGRTTHVGICWFHPSLFGGRPAAASADAGGTGHRRKGLETIDPIGKAHAWTYGAVPVVEVQRAPLGWGIKSSELSECF